ncbi:hypothetical protein N181_30760 [Sinorhizobium fredii USDA 205]|nr:hypothetical protein N181_30760 [Sinorhizobium fredii USDA 205]GEC35591.1 hypothetical protein EFR01_57620 [Sinorhizobium fredii]GLS07190.1 hypothetical protein GCM10007864_08160 [Sinorhizobium fredii]
METDTVELDQEAVEIIPPEPKRCAVKGTMRCSCCQRPMGGDPDGYGICQECIECP